MSGEPKIQEIIDAARGQMKCGIPQRLSAVRQKVTNSKANYPNISKPQARPRSASQTKDDLQTSPIKATPTPRLGRPEKERPTLKRPSTIPRRVSTNADPNKSSRPVITVPVTQKQATRSTYSKLSSGLPSQEVIEKCEELELKKSGLSDTNPTLTDFIEGESITSQSDKFNPMKLSWQEKLAHFERMKKDLTDRQTAILEAYSALRNTHQKLKVSGQKVLPPSEELRIMNVAELTPEQMLQLCNITDRKSDNERGSISIDINKLYNMPSKLIESCEQTLFKRKEIIDWFENLKNQEKGITRSTLSKKVEEFNAENEMMKNSLELAKVDFFTELNQIIEFVRKSVTETIALQLQAEELNYALSDLDSQNNDLRKQIHHLDHLKSHTSKGRVEELEKELKEERCKKIVIKERLTKAEGQMKIGKERASQLEAALEQARCQTWNLERTVQQLQEQNQKLQHDFDREFSKLTESIKENTMHLEEIAEAREKLQTEKEDLEKRLGELSEHYNESIKNMKHEMNINIAKLIDTEKKYEEVNEDKKLLESKVESLCAQLLESQLTLKDTKNLLEEKDLQVVNSEKFQKELETTKTHLEAANVTIEEYVQRLNKQSQAIEDIERNLKETVDLEETLKNKLSDKDEYISELEKKQILLEEQLQESEFKMEAYEEQLSSLKNHISQLQKDFGEFENLNDLHVMINQQTTLRAKLLETTRQNGELAEALQKKELELEQHLVNLAEQESHLEQREGIIKMLTQKEEEQANIIKLLRNNLESRAQADADINQQMMEKKFEMDSLLSKYETSQQTISQLEKIILALEDENRKTSQQRRKEQAKIRSLEDKIAEYETINIRYKRSIDTPSNDLDNFIKILEDELGTGIDNKNLTEHEYIPRQIYVGDYKRSKLHRLDHNIETKKPLNIKEHEKMHTKVILEKTSKKKYEYIRDDQIGRKTGATNIGCQKVNTTEQDMNTLIPPSQNSTSDRKEIFDLQKKYILRNVTPQILEEDKKIKMFKFAGHRI